jgi:hypothetical protein
VPKHTEHHGFGGSESLQSGAGAIGYVSHVTDKLINVFNSVERTALNGVAQPQRPEQVVK